MTTSPKRRTKRSAKETVEANSEAIQENERYTVQPIGAFIRLRDVFVIPHRFSRLDCVLERWN
jgi:hypothetical protein